MNPVTGIGEILTAERSIAKSFERNSRLIPKKISDAFVQQIRITDAIDSGDFLRAVNFHPVQTSGDLLQYLIDTSDNPGVNYGGLVEGGTESMPARFPAQRAIESEDFVSTILALVETPLSKSK